MADPNWNNGFYYDGLPPHTGMKLARRTLSYYLQTHLTSLQRSLLSHIALDQNGINDSEDGSVMHQLNNPKTQVDLVFQPSAPTF
jgi:homoserine acetyltransferase